jgi:hypothetical protein
MKYIFGITIVVAAITAGGKMFEPQFTNVLFQDDLRDTAAQLGWRTGLSPPNSDEDLRNIVIRKAASHEIRLAPEPVLVRHSGTGERTTWYIAVDYTALVNLLVYSYTVHFNATSVGNKF